MPIKDWNGSQVEDWRSRSFRHLINKDHIICACHLCRTNFAGTFLVECVTGDAIVRSSH